MSEPIGLLVIGFLLGALISGLVWSHWAEADRRDAYAQGVGDRAYAEAQGWHQGYIEGWREARLARLGREARMDDVSDVVLRSN
jgi:hypothetical protein